MLGTQLSGKRSILELAKEISSFNAALEDIRTNVEYFFHQELRTLFGQLFDFVVQAFDGGVEISYYEGTAGEKPVYHLRNVMHEQRRFAQDAFVPPASALFVCQSYSLKLSITRTQEQYTVDFQLLKSVPQVAEGQRGDIHPSELKFILPMGKFYNSATRYLFYKQLSLPARQGWAQDSLNVSTPDLAYDWVAQLLLCNKKNGAVVTA